MNTMQFEYVSTCTQGCLVWIGSLRIYFKTRWKKHSGTCNQSQFTPPYLHFVWLCFHQHDNEKRECTVLIIHCVDKRFIANLFMRQNEERDDMSWARLTIWWPLSASRCISWWSDTNANAVNHTTQVMLCYVRLLLPPIKYRTLCHISPFQTWILDNIRKVSLG